MWGSHFFSCYFTPNEGIYDFRNKIDCLEDEILTKSGAIVLAGCLNAKAIDWGIPHPDFRDKYVMEMVARTDFLVLNDGKKPTFWIHRDHTRHLLSSERLAS